MKKYKHVGWAVAFSKCQYAPLYALTASHTRVEAIRRYGQYYDDDYTEHRRKGLVKCVKLFIEEEE